MAKNTDDEIIAELLKEEGIQPTKMKIEFTKKLADKIQKEAGRATQGQYHPCTKTTIKYLEKKSILKYKTVDVEGTKVTIITINRKIWIYKDPFLNNPLIREIIREIDEKEKHTATNLLIGEEINYIERYNEEAAHDDIPDKIKKKTQPIFQEAISILLEKIRDDRRQRAREQIKTTRDAIKALLEEESGPEGIKEIKTDEIKIKERNYIGVPRETRAEQITITTKTQKVKVREKDKEKTPVGEYKITITKEKDGRIKDFKIERIGGLASNVEAIAPVMIATEDGIADDICYGNGEQDKQEAVKNGDVYGLTRIILQLLRQPDYESHSPYHSWQSILEGEEEREECPNCGDYIDECGCRWCESCEDRYYDVCSKCNRCEDCCHCEKCQECGDPIYEKITPEDTLCSTCEFRNNYMTDDHVAETKDGRKIKIRAINGDATVLVPTAGITGLKSMKMNEFKKTKQDEDNDDSFKVGDKVEATSATKYGITTAGNGYGIVIKIRDKYRFILAWHSQRGELIQGDSEEGKGFIVEKKYFKKTETKTTEKLSKQEEVTATFVEEMKKRYEEMRRFTEKKREHMRTPYNPAEEATKALDMMKTGATNLTTETEETTETKRI